MSTKFRVRQFKVIDNNRGEIYIGFGTDKTVYKNKVAGVGVDFISALHDAMDTLEYLGIDCGRIHEWVGVNHKELIPESDSPPDDKLVYFVAIFYEDEEVEEIQLLMEKLKVLLDKIM